jgi:hypothetical protein
LTEYSKNTDSLVDKLPDAWNRRQALLSQLFHAGGLENWFLCSNENKDLVKSASFIKSMNEVPHSGLQL